MSSSKKRQGNASKVKSRDREAENKKTPLSHLSKKVKNSVTAEKVNGRSTAKSYISKERNGSLTVKSKSKDEAAGSSIARASQQSDEVTDASQQSSVVDKEHSQDARDSGNYNKTNGSSDAADNHDDIASEDNSNSVDVPEEAEIKRRKKWCNKKAGKSEQQFCEVREALYLERIQKVESQLKETRAETSDEYERRLAALERTADGCRQTSAALKRFQLLEARLTFDGESSAARQDCQNKLNLLYESLKDDLENKLAKLENDKLQADIDFELWQREQSLKKSGLDDDVNDPSSDDSDEDYCSYFRKKPKTVNGSTKAKLDNSSGHSNKNRDRRRKPVTVTGPYIVYNLEPSEIAEDYKIIQRAIIQADFRNKCH